MIRFPTIRMSYAFIRIWARLRTAEMSVVSFIGFHPMKAHLEDGNYYALVYWGNSRTDQVIGAQNYYRSKRIGNENILRALYTH